MMRLKTWTSLWKDQWESHLRRKTRLIPFLPSCPGCYKDPSLHPLHLHRTEEDSRQEEAEEDSRQEEAEEDSRREEAGRISRRRRC